MTIYVCFNAIASNTHISLGRIRHFQIVHKNHDSHPKDAFFVSEFVVVTSLFKHSTLDSVTVPIAIDSYSKSKACPAFHSLLNAFIELDGCHRFKDDTTYGAIMRRFRERQVSLDDITYINANCVINSTHVPASGVPMSTTVLDKVVQVEKNRQRKQHSILHSTGKLDSLNLLHAFLLY
jgi:hypothetical protein